MTEPIFEIRFRELIDQRQKVKDCRPAVFFLQALFEEAGEVYEEDAAA